MTTPPPRVRYQPLGRGEEKVSCAPVGLCPPCGGSASGPGHPPTRRRPYPGRGGAGGGANVSGAPSGQSASSGTASDSVPGGTRSVKQRVMVIFSWSGHLSYAEPDTRTITSTAPRTAGSR
ncbi:FAD-binding dehydrogenase [Streptomyces laurentii]|uniref:FAD-binding dehydrogenase n=1 Tax=Streptomyces laurentii TaxID=39478 RepID=A0A160P884_STRLU|nr:FAD-binding dehydrogenase [Streptomyces laurentii]